MGENPWQAVLRETTEEANIKEENIIFVRGRDSMEPHVALLRANDKDRVGLVYSATYSGPKLPFEGKDVTGDESINKVACFSWKEILKKLETPDSLYRPEFNFPQLIRWTIEQAVRSRKLSRVIIVDNWLLKKQSYIGGLELLEEGIIKHPIELSSKWRYTPPYNSWMMAKNIHGDPRKTSLA